MSEQGICARRQLQPRLQPAQQLHDTMCNTLSGAEGRSVGIGRSDALDRIHPHLVGSMSFSSHCWLDSTSWKNADVQLHTLVIGLPFGKPFLLTFWHSSSWTQWSWNHPDTGNWKRHIEPAKSLHQLLLCLLHLLLACWRLSQSVPGGHLISRLCSLSFYPAGMALMSCRSLLYSMKKQ